MTGFTRRRLLSLMGVGGGSVAVMHTAHALGLISDPEGPSSSGRVLQTLPSIGPKPTVAVLGAGIGGLSAAYELEQAGYDVVLLEASHRVGGRNFTVRRGTVIDEIGNRQVCDFDDDPNLYFNAGPARIPAVHHRLMNYCREFQVGLEPFINSNYNAWVVDEAFNDGQRQRQRDIIADARGFMAELAAKGVSAAQLDTPLTEEDQEKISSYVRRFGDLSPTEMRYVGSGRAGYTNDGMLDPVQLKPHHSFKEILDSRFVRMGMVFAEGEYQAPGLMQPVGGMDRIVDAFVARLRKAPVTRARTIKIDNRPNSVLVSYEKDNQITTLDVDYCLNSIPGHLMAGIEHNLSPRYTELLGEIKRSTLTKVGFQMSRRFWEDEGIYGGISWTDDRVQQVWYPSHGAQRAKGVVLGAYIFNPEHNQEYTRMSHEERLRSAAAAGEALHPGLYTKHIENGVSIAWQRMNHMLGCGHGIGRGEGREGGDESRADGIRAELVEGDGRHFMLGDQLSRHPGWQEGTLAVTERVLQKLQARQSAAMVASS